MSTTAAPTRSARTAPRFSMRPTPPTRTLRPTPTDTAGATQGRADQQARTGGHRHDTMIPQEPVSEVLTRAALFESPVRPVPVVMVDIVGQDPPQMPAIGDQDPVQALPAHGAHPPHGIRVRLRCLHRGLDRLDVLAGEDRIER